LWVLEFLQSFHIIPPKICNWPEMVFYLKYLLSYDPKRKKVKIFKSALNYLKFLLVIGMVKATLIKSLINFKRNIELELFNVFISIVIV